MTKHIEKLQRVAQGQHGLVARQQLAALGLSRDQIRRRVTNGTIEPVHGQVFRLRGTPYSRRQLELASVLDAGPGAVLSHRSAAHLWGMYRRSERPVHVLRPRDDWHPQRTTLGVLHTTRRLPPEHILIVDRVPVTTPARTLIDLATNEPLGRVARMIDNAWGHHLIDLGTVVATLAQVRARGRRGVRTLDMLIEERIGHRPPESGLEARFIRILHTRGLAPMERQVDLGDADGWICRAHFVDRAHRLVVFIDSGTYHRALLDRRHDDRQTQRLLATGFRVLRVCDTDLLYDEAAVARRVREARSR